MTSLPVRLVVTPPCALGLLWLAYWLLRLLWLLLLFVLWVPPVSYAVNAGAWAMCAGGGGAWAMWAWGGLHLHSSSLDHTAWHSTARITALS